MVKTINLFFSLDISNLIMHTIQLIEPSRWMDILNWWIDIQTKYEWIANLAPMLADIFVVAYPIFLISIYWKIPQET
jgi:hypothetical protein